MAVLLVAMSVMAVMLTVAMPVWKQMAQREKEAELVFRGEQYARAIELMQRKMPGALPPNLDVLVTQKFLRKKYKDPITGEDFDTLSPTRAVPVAAPGASQPGAPTPVGRGASAGAGRSNVPATSAPRPGEAPGGLQAGIIGVVSKSREPSIRQYNGRSRYNEWVFQATQRVQTPGAPAGPGAAPGQRGTAGQPSGRGRGQTPAGRGGSATLPGRGRGQTPPGGSGPAFPRP
jgi:type II secretory pathway pseudopilin PulG